MSLLVYSNGQRVMGQQETGNGQQAMGKCELALKGGLPLPGGVLDGQKKENIFVSYKRTKN